jgi:acyl carrier protein
MDKKKILSQLVILIERIRPIQKNLKKKINEFNYINNGHLDSMEMIRFNFNIEKKFKIKIKPQETTSKKFQTLDGLASIILKKII